MPRAPDLSQRAKRFLDRLSGPDELEVSRCILSLAAAEVHPPEARPIGIAGRYEIRVSGYRIVYRMQTDLLQVFVIDHLPFFLA